MSLHNLRLSFIVVEYNSIEEIVVCTSSILSSVINLCEFEIIISSNSMYSTKYQLEIMNRYNFYKWIFNERNGGFAYAMNQGLKVATGDILVIMNPDVRLKLGIKEMIEFFITHEEIGLIAPMIRNVSNNIQDSYRHFITPWRFLVRHLNRRRGQAILKKHDEPVTVDWVCGAFMMMSRTSYESTNGFDDHYFLYCEDMDLCKRMWLGGYKVIYYPMAEIEYEGTRSARHSWKYALIFLKSLLRYWRKFGITGNKYM